MTHPTTASEKLESSQAHAKKALGTTATAAKEIADTARFVAQSAYRESKDELSAAATDLRHAARATYSSLAEQTATVSQQYCEKACELEAEVSELVREKPLQSIGIAFGIGLFVGLLLSKR